MHVRGRDLIDRHVAERLAIFGQRHLPLRAVLSAPLTALGFEVGSSDLAERGLGCTWHAAGGLVGERIGLVVDDPVTASHARRGPVRARPRGRARY
jgi:hypothetical protein